MKPSRKYALLLLLLDVIASLLLFDLAGRVRGLSVLGDFPVSVMAVPLPFLLVALFLIDGYRPRTDMMSLDYTSLHSISVLLAMTGTLLTTYAIISDSFPLQTSRFVILVAFLLLIPVTLSYRRLIYHRYQRRHGNRSIVFVGEAANCLAFNEEAKRLELHRPILFCSPTDQSSTPELSEAGIELRNLYLLLNEIEDGKLDVEALVLRESNRELPPALSQRLVRYYFNGVPTFTLELFHQIYWRKIPLYRLNQTWLFQEGFQIAREPVFERMKRLSDIILALFASLAFLPFITLGALAVWLDDGGPLFFRQQRVGKNHKSFTIYKLRTMRTGSSAGDPYTKVGDTRITRVGKILRNTRIDELPQVWNVLKGDMSLIGPRAEWDRLVSEYERQIPCYHFRHLVRPGITGWAQVNYPYGANLEDTLRKLEYDLYYIRHFSFILDASIVLKTIHVMLFGKGR